MKIEWDENKNQRNIRIHGISFEEAKGALDDPNAIEFYDSIHSTIEEDRYICIGDIGNFLIVYVVYTDRNGNVRLISARPAEPIEEVEYYEHLKRTFGRN